MPLQELSLDALTTGWPLLDYLQVHNTFSLICDNSETIMNINVCKMHFISHPDWKNRLDTKTICDFSLNYVIISRR